MRSFIQIEQQLGLKKFLESSMGTLYFVPSYMKGPELIVRRFDGKAPPSLVQAYAGIVRASQKWIDRRPLLARFVRVEQPVEVGADFIARKHHVYYVSTESYLDDQNSPEIPEELDQMRQAFRTAIGKSKRPSDLILERVLARSVLEPNGKTYPGDFEVEAGVTQFIVVDPKINLNDLTEWEHIPSREYD